MTFELRALPYPAFTDQGHWFVFSEDRLLVKMNKEQVTIANTTDLLDFQSSIQYQIYLGKLDTTPCFAADLTLSESQNQEYSFVPLRQLFGLVPDQLFWLAARAYHLVNWDRNNQFCGRCGQKTSYKEKEHSKYCPACKLSIYPKISPAIIVAVTDGDKLLLAQNAFYKNKFYSVLAGFVEPGENLEECVKREVKEEAGIEVKNIKYFMSQPWPFPDSLMIAFTAEYAGGELVIDKNELCDAGWYTKEQLPPIPGSISVARKLINWFVENH